jgi:4-amino-4-deoxy-L-arabinose transferase-like glycosyltransferase
MHTNRQITNINKTDFFAVSSLLLISFFLRLYAFFGTTVINRDGVWYINQAKAILNNDWDLARKCGYDFISLYHLLIPFSYKIFGDWILGAKAISLFFGTCAVIPLFFILRRFFRMQTAFVASLAFTMNPFFVSYSVDLVKDPIFWFFALLGFMLFITSLKKEGQLYLLSLSSVSFMIAGFARFEVLIYVIGSLLYLLFFEDKKLKKILIFTGPILLLIILVSVLNTYLLRETLHLWSFYLLPRTHRFFTAVTDSLLRPDILGKSFLALKLLLFKMSKVLYIPFIPIFLISFLNIRKDVKRDRHFRYFILLSLMSLIALYFFYIKIEVLSPRYTVFFILPAFVFICFGIEKIILFLAKRGLDEKYAHLLICLYVMTSVLVAPSNLIHRSTDKIVYKTAGEYIAKIENNRSTIIMAPDTRIMFYANLNSPVIECGNKLMKYDALIKMNYQDMAHFLKSNNVEYFLWEAKAWEDAGYDFLTAIDPSQFRELMRWDSEQGRLILFKVMHR